MRHPAHLQVWDRHLHLLCPQLPAVPLPWKLLHDTGMRVVSKWVSQSCGCVTRLSFSWASEGVRVFRLRQPSLSCMLGSKGHREQKSPQA